MKVMSEKICTHIIFGLGLSGLSCARYFDRIGQTYCVVDTRMSPPGVQQLKQLKYCQASYFGTINESLLNNCELLIVSPGISLENSFVQKATEKGVDVCGDVELFARNCNKPVVAITGSNGKSTVTDLTDQLINASGLKSQKGGNIGLPVLDFLPSDNTDIYVLELSSFQLDTTTSLVPKVAVLLNVSEDHMDRYSSFKEYADSKKQIYKQTKYSVFNSDDSLTYPNRITEHDVSFSLIKPNDKPVQKISFLRKVNSGFDLIIDEKNIMTTQHLRVTGKHNWLNMLASLSVLNCLNIDIDENILNTLKQYKGLEHRFQLISRAHNCEWINDSKATNVGATVAALNSVELENNHHLVLIAGGDSKQSDLTPLIEPVKAKVDYLILLGKDAKKIANLPVELTPCFVDDMKQAVNKAKQFINEGDVVLLSPACASLDMYKNFEERGNAFIDAVRDCA